MVDGKLFISLCVCVCVCVSDLDAFVLETLTLCPNVIIYMFL